MNIKNIYHLNHKFRGFCALVGGIHSLSAFSLMICSSLLLPLKLYVLVFAYSLVFHFSCPHAVWP